MKSNSPVPNNYILDYRLFKIFTSVTQIIGLLNPAIQHATSQRDCCLCFLGLQVFKIFITSLKQTFAALAPQLTYQFTCLFIYLSYIFSIKLHYRQEILSVISVIYHNRPSGYQFLFFLFPSSKYLNRPRQLTEPYLMVKMAPTQNYLIPFLAIRSQKKCIIYLSGYGMNCQKITK